MACAQTGSGKTAAFLIPTIQNLLDNNYQPQPPLSSGYGRGSYGRRQASKPRVVIMCPVRELAIQIQRECWKFTYDTGMRTVCLYGGQKAAEQQAQLNLGCDIVVATPGRLIDFCQREIVDLSEVHTLIMDEADRMLEMGFEEQIRAIVDEFGMLQPGPDGRQTLMVSATFPDNMRLLAADFMYHYLFIAVGVVGSTTSNITQSIKYVQNPDKFNQLLLLLDAADESNLTLVFVETKRGADNLVHFLMDNGYRAQSIHGDRSQQEREAALYSFRMGRTPILIATDVAQRGLDIPHVTHVINFDMPKDIQDYVHRIGRTGRVGNTGYATAFINEQHSGIAPALVEKLREADQEIPEFLTKIASFGGGYGRGGRRGGGGGYGGHNDSRYSAPRKSNRGGGGGGGGWGCDSGW
ncbi:hypothetical protein KIPB_000791 [Kipferlia bialata]|uniref:RNA helicase n=1 Tax=Kipferlia bialata TaxID=797122 RepID=A0A9K3CP01_9EUKA|nr:hypothetical protein KIPB_000791 [Kipferlia bialata]|eukprot:g791.t1